MSPYTELIRMVDEYTSIRQLTVSSELQDFSSALNLTEDIRKTLKVYFQSPLIESVLFCKFYGLYTCTS